MKKFLLSMLGVLIALPGIARNFTYEYEGQTLIYTVIDEEAKTCGTKAGEWVYTGSGGWDTGYTEPGNRVRGELVIPSIAKDGDVGYSVISIGEKAFYGCSGLTSVIIPNSVTSIGDYAFVGCSGMTSVIIGNSITSIGSSAFSDCSGLTSVIIPNSVTSIGNNAFRSCSGLTSVTIPNSVTSIGGYAFHSCSGLTSVTIPNSVNSIGYQAFYGCSGLTSVIIPNSVTSIDYYAFYGCEGLKKSAYPSGLSNPFDSYGVAIEYPREGAIIEEGFVFGQEKNAIYFAPLSLEGEYVIPESVNEIGNNAFEGCSGLTSVTIPNSVTSIGYSAFSGCYGLKKSAYPSGLSNPFSNGIAIEYPREGAVIKDGFVYGPEKNAIYFAPLSIEGEYVMPESVSSVGENAFLYCSGLTSVKAMPVNPPVMNDNSFEGLYETTALAVPENATSDYLATNWALFKDFRIGDSETSGQTYETGNLKYMLIPGKTQEDKNLAVVIPGDYSSLTEVTIPERFTVSENGKNARYYVDGIGFKAFNECSNLATITFNSRNAATSIGDYAFAGTKISALTIPKTVEAIGNHVFDGCKSLTSIAIPTSVKTIGNYAFNRCTALTNANLEAGLKTIGNYAFNDCTALTGIDIPASVKTIGEYAFYGASVLNNISLNDGIESIGNHAFHNCRSLTGIAIPASVKTIGDYALYNTPLNEITLNEGLEKIGEKCFSSSSYRTVESVYIPSTLTSVGEDAFSNLKCEYVNISDLAAWCNIDFANENSNPLSQCGCLRLNNEEVKELIIPERVIAVKQYAFYNCEAVKTLILPNSLTQLANNAFLNCKNITNLTIGTSLEECSGDNFAGCRFEKLNISDGFGNLKLTGSWDNLSIHELYMGRPLEVVK